MYIYIYIYVYIPWQHPCYLSILALENTARHCNFWGGEIRSFKLLFCLFPFGGHQSTSDSQLQEQCKKLVKHTATQTATHTATQTATHQCKKPAISLGGCGWFSGSSSNTCDFFWLIQSIFLCICMYVCVHVSLCVCVCVCVFVCVRVQGLWSCWLGGKHSKCLLRWTRCLKNPTFPQKSPIPPKETQKSRISPPKTIWSACLRWTRCSKNTTSPPKSSISPKIPKEPYVSAKKTVLKVPCGMNKLSKEPYIYAKELYISKRDLYFRKNTLYLHQRALYHRKRALHLRKEAPFKTYTLRERERAISQGDVILGYLLQKSPTLDGLIFRDFSPGCVIALDVCLPRFLSL